MSFYFLRNNQNKQFKKYSVDYLDPLTMYLILGKNNRCIGPNRVINRVRIIRPFIFWLIIPPKSGENCPVNESSLSGILVIEM